MSRLTELIEIGRLRKILRDFSVMFKSPVFLLDKDKSVLFQHPQDAAVSGLVTRPLFQREALIGHVAMRTGSDSSTLDFICRNLSEMAEMGYEVESLAGEIARNYEEFSLLWDLSSRLGAGLDIDKICGILGDEVMDLCPANTVSIFLSGDMPADFPEPSYPGGGVDRGSERKEGVYFSKASQGIYANRASMMTLRSDRGLMGYVHDKREPITVCDVGVDERFEGFPYPVRRILFVPLLVGAEMIGAVVATDKLNGEEFYSTEIKLIFSIASECAVAIKKAYLFDEIRSMLFSTAEAFSLAVDAKDPYTYGHSKRVSDISGKIAGKVGLSRDVVDWIRLAALLHDIGKIGIPDNILHKVGILDSKEMDTIKGHAVAGARMIEQVPRFRELSKWIRHHHEKFDGTGYPSGLKGEAIPLPSRVIALADYFDALTTDRPYRPALSQTEAFENMREIAGSHLDPALFDIFEKIVW